MTTEEISKYIPDRASRIIRRAEIYSEILIENAKSSIDKYLDESNIGTSGLCFVVVGSAGRREALEASDFDFIPIAETTEILSRYVEHDQKIREIVANSLQTKVSRGEDLTKAVALSEIIEPDCIGGARDSSAALTKRILILTESQKITGELGIDTIRRKILQAYASETRTSGRHVLSLCNDISRYYKTLCIEYKAKIDEEDKDWCTRNIKLRHSRKFWYLSNILAVSSLAETHPQGSDAYIDSLLQQFASTPCARITSALKCSHPLELGHLIENYAMFLAFMSEKTNREALANVDHSLRYDMKLGNPFPTMKFNSDVLHSTILRVIDGLPISMRDRIISWFLL